MDVPVSSDSMREARGGLEEEASPLLEAVV
jgi:hypothetical protein